MTADRDRDLLVDIARACNRAIGFAGNSSREDYDHDGLLQSALKYEVLVIGEAANGLSETAKSRMSGIPWHNVIGLRHLLVHHYPRIDPNRIWEVVQEDLPQLLAEIDAFPRDSGAPD